MSTSFSVICRNKPPLVDVFLKSVEDNIGVFLKERGCLCGPAVKLIQEDEYKGRFEGIDQLYIGSNKSNSGFWVIKRLMDKGAQDEFLSYFDEGKKAEVIEKMLQNKFYWDFVRSVGADSLSCIAYGVAAGTLAVMTNGLIFSFDGGWDSPIYPANGRVFLDKYMNEKDLAADVSYRNWAKGCISTMECK